MQLPEYWNWIKRIWQLPTDATLRLVFADWLNENGMPSASARQRRYAVWIKEAREVILLPEIEQVYFRTVTGYYRIKKDGTVHPMPPGTTNWNFGRKKHTLKGG